MSSLDEQGNKGDEGKGPDLARIDELESLIRQKFTKEALSRYGAVKMAHPEKALSLITVLGQLIAAGHLSAAITDDQLRALLEKLGPRRDFTITRK